MTQTLEQHYATISSDWRTRRQAGDYARLVVPSGNASEPLHRWFHMKEAYSHGLFSRLLKDSGQDVNGSLRVLDPCAGSGTTLVSAINEAADREVVADVHGVEANPFLWTLASGKLLGAIHGPSLVKSLSTAAREVESRYSDLKRQAISPPGSTTLGNKSYFKPEYVKALVALGTAIRAVDDDNARMLLRVALTSAVEPAGWLRRDGRALRYSPDRSVRHPLFSWRDKIKEVSADLRGVTTAYGQHNGQLHFGDSRSTTASLNTKFDWIVFSPPYPNNIDYTEVYKLESWILGSWLTPGEMRAQRLGTIRSHPSVKFPSIYSYEESDESDYIQGLLEPLLKLLPDNRYKQERIRTIKGYFDDMWQLLKNCRRLIASDGRLVFVVGNSVHGLGADGLVIAADVLIAAIGEVTGWKVAELTIARNLTRRGIASEYLRESVVTLIPG